MAAEGSLRELKLKIESGATIDRFMKESIDGRTALHCCAAASVTEVLDKDGRSALHLAVMSSNPSLVDLLLTARPGNPNIQDIRRSWTPLMYAAKCRSSTITKLLLKNDARHDIADKDGNTALIIAAENRNTEVFKLLVKRGADLDHRNNSGDSAKSIADTKRLCRLASKGEHEAMGNLLRNKPSIVSSKYPLYSDRSALLCAAAASKRHYSQGGEDHTKCAEILVRFGADLNGQDSKSNTVLHLSVKSKNDSLLKFLLGKDVRVADKRNSDSSTPLMLAAEFDYEQHAELLLEHGARTGSVDELFYHAAKEIAESEGSERVLEVMRNFDQRQREKEKSRTGGKVSKGKQ
uniref:ANK_REP_REGION domain-containing protein n=1 Tax=Macrostomum lignano TaxID=282301 RepID=A0A1I8G3H6_9PLAT